MCRFPGEPHDGPVFSVGEAIWNHRHQLAARREEFERLHAAVDHPGDFSLTQFAQMFAVALEFKPDIIIELGRGWGNSTACFLAAIESLASPCTLISVCRSYEWRNATRPRLEALKPPAWFERLHALEGEITAWDPAQECGAGGRVLLLWDAHGYDIAELVLARIMPAIADRPHLVLGHDIVDDRYSKGHEREYGERGIWKMNLRHSRYIKFGHFSSTVEQLISMLDFLTRNGAHLESADHDIQARIASQPGRKQELEQLLGPLFGPAGWCYFSLNEASGPYTFPRWGA